MYLNFYEGFVYIDRALWFGLDGKHTWRRWCWKSLGSHANCGSKEQIVCTEVAYIHTVEFRLIENFIGEAWFRAFRLGKQVCGWVYQCQPSGKLWNGQTLGKSTIQLCEIGGSGFTVFIRSCFLHQGVISPKSTKTRKYLCGSLIAMSYMLYVCPN